MNACKLSMAAMTARRKVPRHAPDKNIAPTLAVYAKPPEVDSTAPIRKTQTFLLQGKLLPRVVYPRPSGLQIRHAANAVSASSYSSRDHALARRQCKNHRHKSGQLYYAGRRQRYYNGLYPGGNHTRSDAILAQRTVLPYRCVLHHSLVVRFISLLSHFSDWG